MRHSQSVFFRPNRPTLNLCPSRKSQIWDRCWNRNRNWSAETPAEPEAEPRQPNPCPKRSCCATKPVVQNFGSARPQRWGHLKIEFVAESASSTLINALINYRIILTNRRRRPADKSGNFRCHGTGRERYCGVRSRICTHAVLHELPSLASGQSVTCDGQLRLPLTAIRPIAFKSQALFIPLARFRGRISMMEMGRKQRQVAAFVVGREYDPPRQKMAPFRLDLGPGSFCPRRTASHWEHDQSEIVRFSMI